MDIAHEDNPLDYYDEGDVVKCFDNDKLLECIGLDKVTKWLDEQHEANEFINVAQ